MKTDARKIALKIINEIHTKDAYANVALARELAKQTLGETDRRFITELVYGTVKAGTTLDWLLGRFLTRPLEKISPIIRDILRLGVYQIKFMDKIPPSAACNQSVELAKKYGHKGTVGFVNGVLRNFIRQPEKTVYPAMDKNPVQAIALEYFHPEWLVQRWIKEFGKGGALELCQFNNESPPLVMRANTIKANRLELINQLAAEGAVVTESKLVPEGVICTSHPALNSMTSLREGMFQVQDESSMLVAHIVAPKPGDFVIDACSAPGGKSTHMAALMNNQGRVIANDIYDHKLTKIQENATRLGISIIETSLGDAAEIGRRYLKQADCVLVDAPCSGLGVLRRKPDSRWHKKPQQLSELAELQLNILSGAADAVKPGGVLVYSTCSIAAEENESVVERFLAVRADFYLDDASKFMPNKTKSDSMLQFYPHIDKTDGFFIARLKRKE